LYLESDLFSASLAKLSLIELTTTQVLTESMVAKLPHKEIYQTLKNALDRFIVERMQVLGS
jgi:hypothetical protein